jgi:N6-adenosine-specific RNA methylase IME4
MWWLGDWWRFGDQRYGERASQALDPDMPYTFQTLADAGWVAGRIETSDRSEVLSWTHHRAVAALEPNARRALMAEAVENGYSVRDLQQAVRLHRTAERIGKAAGEAADLAAIGTYQVLYVDPPWRYEHAEPTRAIENNYPTMSLDEIKALEPPAAGDAVLFLWATSPKLSESMEVLDAWGFEYRTCMVWVKADEDTGKQHVGMGYYARQQHELLLIAKRGDLPVPAESTRPASVVTSPRTQHSAKPERFYELIESMYPDLARVEMFARTNRDGWAAWGNQAQAVA